MVQLIEDKAWKFAVRSYGKQTDWTGRKYARILHVNNVARMSKEFASRGNSYYQNNIEFIVAVAYLHDVLEHTSIKESELKNIFPNEIVIAIVTLTKRNDESYGEYLNRVKQNRIAKLVKMCEMKYRYDDDLYRISELEDKDFKRKDFYHRVWRYLCGDAQWIYYDNKGE